VCRAARASRDVRARTDAEIRAWYYVRHGALIVGANLDSMEIVIITAFVIGYLAIAFEHSLKVSKTASAVLTGVVCWTLFILAQPSSDLLGSQQFAEFVETIRIELGERFAALGETELFREYVLHELAEHLSGIAQILFFLLGAMTIVELIDAHHGFQYITNRIQTQNPKALLWIICWVAFFLSAVLDNLTTSIVMVSLIRKLIPVGETRLLFAGMIVIAANAGGAWTPIGDVTTTMLWIGGQISTAGIMTTLFLPSVVCLLAPLVYQSFKLEPTRGVSARAPQSKPPSVRGDRLMLVLGIGALIFVPVFKTLTHLPPFLGMLLGLGIVWIIAELIHPELDEARRKHYTVAGALARIDTPSVLFFLGILLAVGVLESTLTLANLQEILARTIGDNRVIITLIGLISAVVDNIPLVAASMGMYSLDIYPRDHMIWEYLAYCAGTGGSILIIGSAAGVAVMGMEKVNFFWYVRRISGTALIGYLAGAATYLLIEPLLF
jgi:Na+/H+ antiporter NhaD/arsenite permease-like protein